ncbi:hypothetical protein D0868_03516 [Hortaea werneckii]|uniref:Uncharacterized protein n=1 Tax=Hortaea werneckii TaxID=91943 RepID=A0A3M7BNP9_HORWE|nr:hypothetical protein D0868_03516 [Hortaea werneckii]RMY41314.1 hypothetical protein D0866_00674 [Hortaea werneckii]
MRRALVGLTDSGWPLRLVFLGRLAPQHEKQSALDTRPGPNLIDPQPREPGNGSTFKSPNRPCPPKPVQPRDDGCSRIPNACFTNGGNDDPQPRDLGNGRRMRKDPQPRDPGNGQHALIDDDGGCEVQAARVNSMMVMSNEPTTRVVGLLLE